ncbi:MAG: methyltransferase domain-containing protein [Armatimonadota bacterium]|nr:methyltransferase domain-containing protein [Armatimonadota bacterium]
MGARIVRTILRSIRFVNTAAAGAAIRLTRWSGKSQDFVHPKHLLEADADHAWYLSVLDLSDVVLDVGCGNARHTARAAAVARLAVGLDRDSAQLQSGLHHIRRLGLSNCHLLEASAESPLPLQSNSVSVVLLLDVLEHLERRQEALREIHRVLEDNGLLLVSAPNRQTSWKRRLQAAGLCVYADRDHKIEYTLSELEDELRRAGFLIVTPPAPVVYDSPWAGLGDLVGAVSLPLYRRIVQWKREAALRKPEESTGFRIVCRKASGG